MVYLLFIIGFTLLFFGGKYLVEGSVSFARDLNISPFIIGIVLVGFGTSAPELITCIKAVLAGSSEIAIGNIVGSNIANILLVLGTGATICCLFVDKKSFKRDFTALIVSSLLLISACFIGVINWYMGLFFILCLLTYIFLCIKFSGLESGEEVKSISKSATISFSVAVLGIAGVVIGANLLVDSAIEIARIFGVSETLIGLSAIAIGTSLPELATIIIASLKKHSCLAFGNIIGSNIFNTFGILGVTSFVRKIEIPKSIIQFDVWAMLFAVLFLFILALKNGKVRRKEGIFLLVLYIIYMTVITIRG